MLAFLSLSMSPRLYPTNLSLSLFLSCLLSLSILLSFFPLNIFSRLLACYILFISLNRECFRHITITIVFVQRNFRAVHRDVPWCEDTVLLSLPKHLLAYQARPDHALHSKQRRSHDEQQRPTAVPQCSPPGIPERRQQ